MTTVWRKHFPLTGPSNVKCNLVKSNLAAAGMSFEQRTNAAEAPSVGAKRALDIGMEASASTKRPRVVVEIVDSD